MTTLAAGDIAFVGFASDTASASVPNGKAFSFVLLKDVDAGTVINFTDNGWTGTAFRTGEGVMTWTATGGLTAGTVITITGTGAFNLATGGDQILAYTGTAAAPTFLAGIDLADDNLGWDSNPLTSNTSTLPAGLSGSSALTFSTDDGAYTGPTTGTADQIRAAIADPANWTLSDTTQAGFPTSFHVLTGQTGVSVSNVTVAEGDAGDTLMTFTVTRTDTDGAFSLHYATQDGTATSASGDYDAASGTVSFTAGGAASQTVTVIVHGDTAIEGNETLTLNLSNLVNAAGTASLSTSSATGTIANDDQGPPSVAISDVTLVEGDNGTTNAVFTVTRTGGTGAFSVDFATADGTATAGSDYAETHGALSFAAGVTTQTITVAVNGDTAVEADETFTVNLSNATGGAVVADAQGLGTITNNDHPPAVNANVWLNEFHYDNTSTDVGEFVEVAARAGTDLSGYSIVLYNGNGGAAYATIALSGVVADQGGGFGVVSVPAVGIQNGSPDGIALVGPAGAMEFISYEGTFTATTGPAAGMTSTDVGVAEDGTANGTSIARTGEGLEGSEFHWTLGADSHGQLNPGETFPAVTARVHVSDVSVTEGDNGTKLLTFNVTRAGAGDAFSVHYATADGTATAGSDYTAVSGDLTFAAGEKSKLVQVVVNGDTDFERNESFTLNLSGATNGAVIVDSHAQGAILNDDVAHLHTYEIQGAGHTSEYVGQHVITEGVVTAIDTTGSRGFWIQDQTGDGNDATSDAVFVFTNGAVTANVGDKVQVDGTVDEFGKTLDPNNLTITEVSTGASGVTVLGTGFSIAPTIIGEGGRLPPTEAIGDDNDAFDPQHQGMDFYESMEGMLVTVKNAQVTDASFGNSTWVVADNGAEATGLNARGGITIGAGAGGAPDMNPERIQLFYDSGVAGASGAAVPTGSYLAGAQLGNVTGVVTYFGGEYELIPTAVQNPTATSSPARETTTLSGDADHVTIGAYNVENLDPVNDPQSKFDQLGVDIVHNLGAPDILGLEEIQDADGAGAGSDFSGAATVAKLVDAIVAAGGPHYQMIEVVPTAATGGEPNGHIHQVFLYNPDRVQYVDGSARTLHDTNLADGDTYNNSREPLVADFTFHGETITAVEIHNYSRGGSDELFGANQPPNNSGDQRRTDQTTPVKQYVDGLVAANPNAHVVVMGDFNGFQFETAQTQLESSGHLENLTNLLDPTDRYSFSFGGNMEQIDQFYASTSLQPDAQFDIVHLNTGQAVRPTDHDPIVSRLLVNTAPVGTGETYGATEDVKLTVDTAHGLLVNDTDANHDALTAVLQQGPAHGTLTLSADGSFAYQAAANYNGSDSFTYLVRDPSGAVSGIQTVSLNVAAVNDAPVITAPVTGTAVEGGATTTLDALSHASDVEGSALSVVGVPTALPAGVTYDATARTFVLDPANAAYNSLGAGQTQVVSVAYGVSDGDLTTAQTASWTVTGTNDTPVAAGDAGHVNENQSVTLNVLGNDTDVDQGDTKTIVSVSATALGGHVAIVDGQLVYTADAEGFDLLTAGVSVVDHFTYTMRDAGGLTSTATVDVTVTGVADGAPQFGGNGNSSLTGTAGDELLSGGNGNDRLLGLDGADTLMGGNGNDTAMGGAGIDVLTGDNGDDSLDGGAGSDALAGGNGSDTLAGGLGNDLLTGGNGGDKFVFAGAFGRDVVADFERGSDHIQLDHLQFHNFADVMAHASQVGGSVVITLDADDSITLLNTNLSSLRSGDFLFA